MVAGQDTGPRAGSGPEPAVFRAAVEQMHAAPLRAELHCEEMPAPQRIAPYASALSADVRNHDEDVGGGRLILLHDPAGNEAWEGTFRCVAYARAELDLDLSDDPVLSEVGWSYLTEALEAHGAEYAAPSGSVTTVVTKHFGRMAEDPTSAQLELRASWTPLPGPEDHPELTAHVEAWGDLLCQAAGLPPVPDGVTTMPARGQRGSG